MAKIILLGGTITAIESAVHLRRSGHQVTLVTPLTYVGDDLTAAWQSYGIGRQDAALARLNRLPDLAKPFDRLLPGQLKRELQGLLLHAGVDVIYMQYFAGLDIRDGQVTGVLLAGKSGILRLAADLAIDATLFASPTFSLAGRPVLVPAGMQLTYQLEYFGLIPGETAQEKDSDGIVLEDGIRLFRGPVRPDQGYVAIERICPRDMTLNEAQGLMRVVAAEAARRLHRDQPLFAGAWLAGALPASISRLNLPLPDVDADPAGWLRALPDDEPARLLAAIQATADSLAPDGTGTAAAAEYLVYGRRIPATACRTFPLDEPDPVWRNRLTRLALPWKDLDLPVAAADAAVIGGGTAGLCAAKALADAGRSVRIVEFFSNPGGTRTIGGVNAFYLGNRNALFQAIFAEIQQQAALMNTAAKHNQTLTPEMLYYNELFWQKANAIDYATAVCAAETTDCLLKSVLGVGDGGMCIYQAPIYLDATGDADLTELAGGRTAYGSAPDNLVQDYSLWYRPSGSALDPAMSCNLDQDVLDSRYLSEWQRAIAYNNENAPDYDLYEMLTVRESRRIQGLVNVSLRDIVRGKTFPNVIYEAYSDYDPHSRCFLAEGRLGLLPQHAPGRFVGIPLESLIPEKLRNVLVVAKGVAFDQDAFNYVRMNPDMMSLGSIGGQIAALALAQHCLPEQLDLTDLRRELQAQGAVGRLDQRPNDVRTLIERLCDGDETAFGDAVLADWPNTGVLLASALQSGAGQDSLLTGKTLLWFGDRRDSRRLIDALEEMISCNPREVYRDRNDNHPGNIKGGILGALDEYWLMNQLAYILARAQVAEAAPAISRMLDNAEAGGSSLNDANPYILGRIDNQTIPNYDRIFVLAEAARAMPLPLFAPALERLLADPAISGYRVRRGEKARINFHMALLELKLAEAAARCGSAAGLARLDDYILDLHATLARYAQRARNRD